ncbi:hypothetical protein Tco_0610844 [Tanacetum coccineum]
MSNTNTNLQTQTSNALHNAIMEAGGKERPPILAPGNYVQWKSKIKRYIDTKPNNELIYYCLQNPPYNFKWIEKTVPIAEGSSETTIKGYMENYKNVSQDIRNQLDAKAEAKAIKRLKQGELINVQDLETNLYWEIRKFTSRDEWQKFVTLVKKSQELKTISYHKLYDILKQHQYEVNEIKDERLERTTNPLALVAQQQLVYHPQNHPTHYTHNSSTRSQQAATGNKGKAIVNPPPPTYDQEPEMVAEDNALSKEKQIDKLMALISLSFKKIYKPTNNNLRTSSNTSRANKDNTPRINRCTGYDNQRVVNVAKDRENVEQADWRDDTDDEPDDQELETHYMYMAQIQEVTPNVTDSSGPIFDTKPLQKVQNDDDNYYVFANDREHPEQPESVNDTYLDEQGDTNITIDSLDMSTNGETVDQDDDDLARERDLLASLIDKLKCEIDDSKNRNKLLESSNKTLVDKLKGEIKDFKTKNKNLKKFQAELDRYHDVNYASKVEIDCAKAKGCYNDDLALMLAPESDETIRLAHESRSKLRVISTTSVSRPQLKSNRLEDRVMHNNSEGKKQQVEDHRRNFKFSNNKMSITACNDSLNAKTSTVNFVSVTYGKCVLNDNHDMNVTPPDTYSVQGPFGGVTDWYQEPRSWLFQLSQFLRIHQRIAQELLLKLIKDLHILKGIQQKQAEQEEPVAQNFLINLNFPMADDDEYTVIYRKPKAITPDLPIEEPDNSLSMGDEHLNIILETEKSSIENLVPIPSEFKVISENICDVPSCDNDHFDVECGLINSLLSRDILITSPKIDFLPEEFVGELDFIDPILPGIDEDDFDEDDFDEDDFDEEEGEIDNDILQIEDEILREKLLNVDLLIDKIEALKLTPSIPFVLENPSSSPILVVDSDFLVEEVDTFLVSEDSIPLGIESDFDSEEGLPYSLQNTHRVYPIQARVQKGMSSTD